MKSVRLMVSVVCVALLLANGQAFGQRDKAEVLPPQKGKMAKEEAELLVEKGWKTNNYTIEEQLASTWNMMCSSRAEYGDSRYLWVEKESSGSNLQDVTVKNLISGVTNLTYQVETPFICQCKLVMMQKKGTMDQMANLEKIVRQVSPMVVQNLCRKSMEIYREQDKTFTVRTVYMIDKSKVYDILLESCVKDASAYKDNAFLVDVFKETLNRMNKQGLR